MTGFRETPPFGWGEDPSYGCAVWEGLALNQRAMNALAGSKGRGLKAELQKTRDGVG